jgi:hypothetical protein
MTEKITKASRFFFCAVIVALACLGLLGLPAYGGTPPTADMVPTLLGGALAFVILGLFWWLAVGRSLLKALPIWILLAIPAAAYILTAGELLWTG